ncbi:hypothetical protein JL720_15397 [Aureococcus anophagefferens]|nr:hypothetical protein JL720_15397 [Aureococcus anophagefferens]
MAFSAIANYEITLDSESGCFWPGDAVTGRLVLETTKPIKCRGIRIRLEGVGVGHWHTGGGDDRKDYHAEKKYVSKTTTVFGNFYRTQLLDECGENATILAGGQPVSMPLYRKGKSGDLGEVTLSAARRHGARPVDAAPITLLARARLPPPNAYAPVVRGPTEAQIIYKCECCVPCGLGCEQGTAQFQACVSQAAVSVGDVVYVAALATNSTEHEATFHVDLVTKIRIERRNGKGVRGCRRPLARLGGVALPGNSTINFGTPDAPVALKIPACRRRSRARRATTLTWAYALQLTIDMPGGLTDVVWEFP